MRGAACLAVLWLLWAPAAVWAADAAQTAQELETLAKAALDDAAGTLALAKQERAALTEEAARLDAALAAKERRLAALDKDLAVLEAEEEARQQSMEDAESEAGLILAVLRAAAADADRLLAESPLAVERPGVRASLQPLLDPREHPGPGAAAALAEALFAEMEQAGRLAGRLGWFLGPDGRRTQGRILRLGRLAAWWDDGDRTGFLRLDAAGGQYKALGAGPSWSLANDLEDFVRGQGPGMVLDLSGGAVLERLESPGGALAWLRAGGFLVWPILLVGAAALVLTLERLWTLLGVRTRTGGLMADLAALLAQGRVEDGRAACAARPPSPACRVLAAGLEHAGRSRDVIENAFHEAILREAPRLERFLPTLAVLASVAPLLGLLGTVTGMINTFTAITFSGGGDPRTLSGGISEALVTTELGLMVAIPVMVAHHFLERRAERIMADMEEKGVAVTVALLCNGDGHVATMD